MDIKSRFNIFSINLFLIVFFFSKIKPCSANQCNDARFVEFPRPNTGIMTFKGFINNPRTITKCQYQLVAPPNMMMRIKFKEFEFISPNNTCTARSLSLLYHEPTNSRSTEEIHCGLNIPQSFTNVTTFNATILVIISEAGFSGKFKLEWWIYDPGSTVLQHLEEPNEMHASIPTSTSVSSNYNESDPQIIQLFNSLRSRCGKPNVNPRGRGNSNGIAKPYSWPWMVKLEFLLDPNSTTYYLCGGTILSKRIIITAAHCVIRGNQIVSPNMMRVRSKIHNITQPLSASPGTELIQSSTVASVHIYNQYSDLALLVLEEDLIFGDKVSPACLPAREDVARNTECYVTGWGLTTDNQVSQQLKQMRMQIETERFCQDRFSNTSLLMGQEFFCASVKNSISRVCQGDSGGPFSCFDSSRRNWFILGVTSLTNDFDCLTSSRPSGYVRLWFYLNWIRNRIVEAHQNSFNSSTVKTEKK